MKAPSGSQAAATAPGAMTPLPAGGLLDYVRRQCGERVQDCYQCGKCSAGCVLYPEMDLGPRRVMRAIQLGLKAQALRSSTIWLCVHCHACSERCPQEIDVAAVMESLRVLAQAERVPAAVPEVPLLERLFAGQVKRLGRIFEPGLGLEFNLRSHRPFSNARLAAGMVARGKLSLLPPMVKGREAVADLFRQANADGQEDTRP